MGIFEVKIETDVLDILRSQELPKILEANSGKNFVKRILTPQVYPNLPLGEGMVGTHRMASGESDGKYYSYPTIVQGEDGKLMELPPDQAFRYAMDRGEFIEFPNNEEADWFSRNYKRVWGE